VDIIKTTIAHDNDLIRWLTVFNQSIDDLARVALNQHQSVSGSIHELA
jgi:hypothetical protein